MRVAVSNFDMVMGPEAFRLLEPKTVAFGPRPNHSAFLETDEGAMLMGEPERILKNLRYLPSAIAPREQIQQPTIKYGRKCSPMMRKAASLNTCTVKEVIDDRVAVIETKIRDATDEVLEQCSDVFL